MCRKKYLRAWCAICFGLGVILGHCTESWMLCCGGGSAMIFLGLWLLNQK